MSHYISIAELPPTINEENRLAWNVQLPPHIDAERLEINTTRLARFGRIAGFSGVIIDEYIGEQTTYETPAVGGVFNDGTAAGVGSAKANKVERYKCARLSTKEERELPPQYRWPVARVSINRPELTRNIIDKKKDKDDHQIWAEQLDSVLRRGLLRNAHLATGDNSHELAGILGSYGGGQLVVGTVFQEPLFFGLWATVYGASLAFERKALKTNFQERRLSLFPWGLQYDRLALAAAYSSLGFIRDRGQKTQKENQ
ncbi:MAG TPA: hypothetical protein VF733_01890 [Candidatus Saccharimonadales bacterium]